MKKYPVTEIFGPTIQGEGMDQGVPVKFVRFGGCDFRCEWCDTPHAVLPHMVRQSKRMSDLEIIDALEVLPRGPSWVVLSGGNPALHDLSSLTRSLQERGYEVSVETQGTKWKNWLAHVDRLCVSPKPPSSGMKYDVPDLTKFLNSVPSFVFFHKRIFLKVVVFDNADYDFAQRVHVANPGIPFFLSAGNDAGATVGNPSRRDTRTVEKVRGDLFDKARWLTNKVMVDPLMADARVQAQYHVALWGNELGR